MSIFYYMHVYLGMYDFVLMSFHCLFYSIVDNFPSNQNFHTTTVLVFKLNNLFKRKTTNEQDQKITQRFSTQWRLSWFKKVSYGCLDQCLEIHSQRSYYDVIGAGFLNTYRQRINKQTNLFFVQQLFAAEQKHHERKHSLSCLPKISAHFSPN